MNEQDQWFADRDKRRYGVTDTQWEVPMGVKEASMGSTPAVALVPDAVMHPSHYTQGEIESIDAIRAALGDEGFVAYCKGNAIKYTWRAGLKGSALEDTRKARVYMGWAEDVQSGRPLQKGKARS